MMFVWQNVWNTLSSLNAYKDRALRLPYIVKISQKRYSTAGINFLQPLSAQAQQARKMNISSA